MQEFILEVTSTLSMKYNSGTCLHRTNDDDDDDKEEEEEEMEEEEADHRILY